MSIRAPGRFVCRCIAGSSSMQSCSTTSAMRSSRKRETLRRKRFCDPFNATYSCFTHEDVFVGRGDIHDGPGLFNFLYAPANAAADRAGIWRYGYRCRTTHSDHDGSARYRANLLWLFDRVRLYEAIVAGRRRPMLTVSQFALSVAHPRTGTSWHCDSHKDYFSRRFLRR